MKVAINCIFFQPKSGGIKEYIYNLVNNISVLDNKNDYILYVLADQYDYAIKNFPEETNFRIKIVPYASEKLSDKIKRSLFINRFWQKEEKIEKFNLFHSPFFHSPKLKYSKIIITVHDLRFYRYPSTYNFLRYIFLKHSVKRSITTADHIISISEFTKGEIIDAYKISSSKITVIHEAINESHFKGAKYPSEEVPVIEKIGKKPYILTVGHIEPRKNYSTLIDCFLKLKSDNEEYADLQLIIVGKKEHKYKKVIKKINSSHDIIYLNFVSHELLCWLYGNARLFVFPSFYEGFGFPPLEAAAFGTVSAVSELSSIPEVCGNSAFYFNPFDKGDIERILHKTLSNNILIEEKKKLLKENLSRFSWERNANETLNLYNRIIK